MAQVALTRIQHGEYVDGKDTPTVWDIPEDEEIPEDFPKDALKDLVAGGSIDEPPMTPARRDEEMSTLRESNADLQARVDELQAQLAAAKESPKQQTPPPTADGSGGPAAGGVK